MFELGLRADRDDVVEQVNYSPRVGVADQRVAGGPRHPARRRRQVRGAHAAQRRRVHAVRRPDDPPLRGERHAARRSDHLRARRRGCCRLPRASWQTVAWDQRFGRRVFFKAAYLHRNGSHAAVARTRSRARRVDALTGNGESKYWEFETTGRYLASEHRDLSVSYVRSHGTRDLNDYDQFFGNFRNPIIRPNENSLSSTDVPNRRDRPRHDRPAGTVGAVATLRVAHRIPVVGGQRIPGLRRPAQSRAAGCRPSRRSTSRSCGRCGFASTGSPPASRSTTPSTPATSATCRTTSPSPDYGKFYNPIQRSIGFVLGSSRP